MFLDKYINEIAGLCKKNRVRSLYVFGSAITDRFSDESDIDLVVDIDSDDTADYTEKYFDLKFTLQDILKRKVDLLEAKAIRNKYLLKEIDQTKSILYGA